MDRKTEAVLGKISASVPQHLANNVTKVAVDDSEEKLAIAAVESNFISDDKKEVLRKKIEAGAFIQKEVVTNDEVGEEIGEYNAKEVAKAREAGALADPMTDPFYRRQMEQARAVAEGRVTPQKVVVPERDLERAAWEIRRSMERGGNQIHKKYY